jgi:hypothetical protein
MGTRSNTWPSFSEAIYFNAILFFSSSEASAASFAAFTALSAAL